MKNKIQMIILKKNLITYLENVQKQNRNKIIIKKENQIPIKYLKFRKFKINNNRKQMIKCIFNS